MAGSRVHRSTGTPATPMVTNQRHGPSGALCASARPGRPHQVDDVPRSSNQWRPAPRIGDRRVFPGSGAPSDTIAQSADGHGHPRAPPTVTADYPATGSCRRIRRRRSRRHWRRSQREIEVDGHRPASASTPDRHPRSSMGGMTPQEPTASTVTTSATKRHRPPPCIVHRTGRTVGTDHAPRWHRRCPTSAATPPAPPPDSACHGGRRHRQPRGSPPGAIQRHRRAPTVGAYRHPRSSGRWSRPASCDPGRAAGCEDDDHADSFDGLQWAPSSATDRRHGLLETRIIDGRPGHRRHRRW